MIPQNLRCCCLHILCLFRQFRNILRKFFAARVLRMAVFPIKGIEMLAMNAILLSCLLSNTEYYHFMHSSISHGNILSKFYKISILISSSIFCMCSGKTIYKIHHATRRR